MKITNVNIQRKFILILSKPKWRDIHTFKNPENILKKLILNRMKQILSHRGVSAHRTFYQLRRNISSYLQRGVPLSEKIIVPPTACVKQIKKLQVYLVTLWRLWCVAHATCHTSSRRRCLNARLTISSHASRSWSRKARLKKEWKKKGTKRGVSFRRCARKIDRTRAREMAREFLTVSCTQLRPDAAPTPG